MAVHWAGRGPGHISRNTVSGQTPLTIFGSSLKTWFDVQDLSTMWQDTSATTPAAVGQRVAKQFCKANPAFYRQQTTLAQRPFLRQDSTTGAYYLECDGLDDGMVTPALDLSTTSTVTLFTAIRKVSDAVRGMVVESNNGGNGQFYLAAPDATPATQRFAFFSKGTIAATIYDTALAAPVTVVVEGVASISTPLSRLRLNGAQVGTSSASQGTGTFANVPVYYFRRGGTTLPFNGWEYGSMFVTAIPTAAQSSWAEAYFNSLSASY